MPHQNPITAVFEAAKRHNDNPAVGILANKLETAQILAKTAAMTPVGDPLAGYRKGGAGEEGYSLMHSINAEMFPRPNFQEITCLHEVTVIASCLAAVLNDLGENIDL